VALNVCTKECEKASVFTWGSLSGTRLCQTMRATFRKKAQAAYSLLASQVRDVA
jgi:hypothetical protein